MQTSTANIRSEPNLQQVQMLPHLATQTAPLSSQEYSTNTTSFHGGYPSSFCAHMST
jgi:hypothetical protein